MSPEMVAYPFLFLTIFFESFVLVTFLSKPARSARARLPSTSVPSVAIIVPCWNEATTVAGTCNSLLALDYPKDKLEVILVDDGSTDSTQETMAQFNNNPQVRIIRKENGGSYTALNAGLAITNAEFIGCLDADSFVDPGALREIISCFDDPTVVATTSAIIVHEPKTILQHMQHVEYVLSIALRHVLSSVNGLYVTPGPFSFYRRATILSLGGFKSGYQSEDLEMALRLQRAGYRIENTPQARVYTKSPDTLQKLIKQRVRWTTGLFRNVLGEYRDLLGNYKHGALGMLVLPITFVSIASGILLFFLMIYQFIDGIVSAFEIRSGIPLSYSLLPRLSFDYFYLPINLFLVLGVTALLVSFSLIAIGKRISNAPGNIGKGLISYVLFYGLVAPLWLLRATAEVVLGKHSSWR